MKLNGVNIYLLLLLASVTVAAFSQVLLKCSARRAHSGFLAEYLNPFVLAGYGLLLVSTVLTVLASGPEAETVTDHERQRRFWSVQEFAKDFGAQVSVSTPHPDRLLVHFTLPTGARTA